jgi:hypothetical protein
MAINTQVQQSEWQEFFVNFTNGNRGRQTTIEIFDRESGSTGQARQGPLMAVNYDPVGKGNDVIITTGIDEIEYSHTISAPVEVWQEQNDDGSVAALQIVDHNQVKTIVSLGD